MQNPKENKQKGVLVASAILLSLLHLLKGKNNQVDIDINDALKLFLPKRFQVIYQFQMTALSRL